MAGRPFIYAFSTDLRLDDHAGLAAAASQGDVLPALVVDDALRARLRASPRRAAFFCAAVASLAADLHERGSRLVVRRGPSPQILREVALATQASGAAWSASYDAAGMERDRALQSALEERGLRALVVHDALAVPPDESAEAHSAGPGYRAFAPYFERWSKIAVASYENPLLLRFSSLEVESENLPTPHEFGSQANEVEAGASVGLRIFERFLARGAPDYALRATIPSEDGTSHLGPHLSFGTVAARTVVRVVRDRIGDPLSISEARLSLRLFLRALARRDFFLQLGWFYPETFALELQEKMRGFAAGGDRAALEDWRTGRTGFPLVDAGVRQLRETGWMHPHVRAVAASFLCFDLGVDWRVGRDEWDRLLVEDDPALATGNWQWIAGVGADMAQFPRVYNPDRQRRRFDPDGRYCRRWIPELRHVPSAAWHGHLNDSAQLPLALFDGGTYPRPLVDHARAARDFLARYRAFVSP
jgi:deoxyribodipyrimidine photo-lyase